MIWTMSEQTAAITNELLHYMAAHTIQEDEWLRALKREAAAAGLPPIWIAPEQGSLMQILLRLGRAREVVEVGTLAGYSAIWMARALPDAGRVHTIEVSDRHADFAERWIAESDVAGKIKVYRGAGKAILPKFKSASMDAFFIDADKPSYPLYLQHALRLVRPGGLIMADNAFAFGELLEAGTGNREAEALRAFNQLITQEASLQSIIVPLGDGLWVSARL